MPVIPLAATPSQTVTVAVSGQRLRINVYEKTAYKVWGTEVGYDGVARPRGPVTTRTPALYADVFSNDALVAGGVICRNGMRLLRQNFTGFVGDLVFFDLAGNDDPLSAGLGTRWFLYFLPDLA